VQFGGNFSMAPLRLHHQRQRDPAAACVFTSLILCRYSRISSA
jgi:hypothetical protein